MVVQGAIGIHNLIELKKKKHWLNEQFCIGISDREKDEWDICGKDEEDIKDWKCKILEVLGESCEDEAKPVEV